MPADWLGVELGVAPPTFVDRGKAEFAPAEEVKRKQFVVYPSRGDFEHVAESELEIVDLRKRHRYDVTLPEGIDLVATTRAARLASVAAQQAPEAAAVQTPKAEKVVSGDDTRVPMGIAQGYGRETWLAAIGSLNCGGTATLIGPNVAITAAHVMFSTSGEYAEQVLFHPRGDWSQGDWDPSWGAWDVTQIAVPAAYTRNNCHKQSTTDCEQYDIAFLRLSPDATTPGHRWWFTPLAESRAELATRELKNRGYPACDRPSAPPNCIEETLFGDQASCMLGPDVYPEEEYSAVVFHSCDTNEGHSGGPMFYYTAQGNPVQVGVHVGGRTPPRSPTSNTFKRFSPNTLKWINGLL
jgi:V8-like Glu-specific endopeptidase